MVKAVANVTTAPAPRPVSTIVDILAVKCQWMGAEHRFSTGYIEHEAVPFATAGP